MGSDLPLLPLGLGSCKWTWSREKEERRDVNHRAPLRGGDRLQKPTQLREREKLTAGHGSKEVRVTELHEESLAWFHETEPRTSTLWALQPWLLHSQGTSSTQALLRGHALWHGASSCQGFYKGHKTQQPHDKGQVPTSIASEPQMRHLNSCSDPGYAQPFQTKWMPRCPTMLSCTVNTKPSNQPLRNSAQDWQS